MPPVAIPIQQDTLTGAAVTNTRPPPHTGAEELVDALYAAGLHLRRAHRMSDQQRVPAHIDNAAAHIDETVKYIYCEFYARIRNSGPP